MRTAAWSRRPLPRPVPEMTPEEEAQYEQPEQPGE